MIRHATVFLGFASCVALWLGAAAPARGALISEVLYDAPGSDNGLGFVEIAGAAGTSLEGWSLVVINGADGSVATMIPLGGIIPSDRIFVVADRDASGDTLVPGADRVENFDIQNGPDSLQLLDAVGSVVDALGFGVFGPGEVFAGEGSPAADGAAGESLERLFADVDTGDNAIDFAIQSTPTPGTALFSGSAPGGDPPGAPIPEPRTALLYGLGLIALGLRR